MLMARQALDPADMALGSSDKRSSIGSRPYSREAVDLMSNGLHVSAECLPVRACDNLKVYFVSEGLHFFQNFVALRKHDPEVSLCGYDRQTLFSSRDDLKQLVVYL
jgi:hypothetical protein